MSFLKYREDTELMPEVQAAQVRGVHPMATTFLVMIGLGLIFFLAWAAVTRLDEVTRGDGRVIPSLHNQVLQHLDGGIVTRILVKEGDIVKKGQTILRVENRGGEAKLKEKRVEYWALRARAVRLEAEADSSKTVPFPAKLVKDAPRIVTRERAVFDQNKRNLDSEIQALKEKVAQREAQLKEQRSLVQTLKEKARSLTRERNRARRMVRNGSMSRLELVRTQRELSDTEGRVRTETLALGRLEAAIEEARKGVSEKRGKFIANARLELADIRKKAETVAEELKAIAFRIQQTDLKSPFRGTIKKLRVATEGGVVKAGEPLVEIVPLNDTLIIEAKVRPSDIAFIRLNQKALVKMTAYNYTTYGGLDGTVIGISPDTIEDKTKKGETFYKITVRTQKNFLIGKGRKLLIIPGMTAVVNIKTGRKSVLAYIFKPITKSSRAQPRGRQVQEQKDSGQKSSGQKDSGRKDGGQRNTGKPRASGGQEI